MGFKSHILKKKNWVSPGLTWVDSPGRPGRCIGWSFDKPGLVQPPSQPAGPIRV